MQRPIRIDETRCTGCRACLLACSERHGHGADPRRARLRVVKDDLGGVDRPVVCELCDDAPCVAACRLGALAASSDGRIRLDPEKCVPCGACMDACTDGSLRADPATGLPLFCDLCDGHPACVAACVNGTLTVADRLQTKADRPQAEAP